MSGAPALEETATETRWRQACRSSLRTSSRDALVMGYAKSTAFAIGAGASREDVAAVLLAIAGELAAADGINPAVWDDVSRFSFEVARRHGGPLRAVAGRVP